jgi:hypothetical protein
MKKILCVVALVLGGNAFAVGLQEPVATSDNVTRAYAGVKWTLGGSSTPELVVGVRTGKVKSSGKVYGNDVSMAVNIENGFKPSQVRVKYFDGKVRNQNEVAVGYDFTKGLFGGVSVKAPYVNVGLDVFSVKELDVQPWMILDTHKKYKKLEEPAPEPV